MRLNLSWRLQHLKFSFLTIVVVLAVWYAVTAKHSIQPIFLPSPARTFAAIFNLLASGRFFFALLASVQRILVASILAVGIGAAIGIVMGLSEKIEYLFNPIVQPIRYLPIAALIPLLVLWFGIGESMKISFLFIAILSYFIPLVRDAVRNVPQVYVDVAHSFGVGKWTIVKSIHVPHALPRIFEGLIIVNAIGWNYIILAEIINARNGLGYLINIAGRLQRSDEVFAGLMLIALVAIMSDYLLRLVREKKIFW
jgi:ABC-type nitrate/sulfonate/bicarbonate transport system permease component